jgi:hypothetical protein
MYSTQQLFNTVLPFLLTIATNWLLARYCNTINIWYEIDILTIYFFVWQWVCLTVQFLSSATIGVLVLLLISQSIESFIDLRVRLSEKSFVLKCVRDLHKIVYERLLGSDWYRLKLAHYEEMRRKINEACIYFLHCVLKCNISR